MTISDLEHLEVIPEETLVVGGISYDIFAQAVASGSGTRAGFAFGFTRTVLIITGL